MLDPIMMTEAQLQMLLNEMRQMVSDQSCVVTPQPAVNSKMTSFTKCQSRFCGMKEKNVDAFINAISIYKECLYITDENALRGLPMILDSSAATWFLRSKVVDEDLGQCLKRFKINHTMLILAEPRMDDQNHTAINTVEISLALRDNKAIELNDVEKK
ncbi:hypothetical protein RN001_007297 [Aquatica leii]|uniref:Uncharacterized protein n=1 Tax=Aquatica leii TaxID=1421715 RepID=A0AAN7S917_9COLE|nr:hypothetical protein RN001_007297 [Aquatica leii]